MSNETKDVDYVSELENVFDSIKKANRKAKGQAQVVCRFGGCNDDDICPNCGYCALHHYVPIVDNAIDFLYEEGRKATIEWVIERGKTPWGKLDLVSASLLALIMHYVPEGDKFPDWDSEELADLWYDYFDVLVTAVLISGEKSLSED